MSLMPYTAMDLSSIRGGIGNPPRTGASVRHTQRRQKGYKNGCRAEYAGLQGYNLSWRRGSNRADKGVFMSYINKDLKELIITLAAVIGFGDVLVKTGRLHQEDEDAAKLMMGAATTISQHLLQGRDAEQVEALQRQAGFYEIIAVPKSSAQIGKEYYICPKEDFERLVIDDPSSPCPYCELEGREAHRCERRRNLMRCGVAANTTGDCPYKGM